jgi:hypothetical protein
MPVCFILARLLQEHWGDGTREKAGQALGSYLRARGVEGTPQEILTCVKAQLACVESSASFFQNFELGQQFLPFDVRPAVRLISSVVRRGPERRCVSVHLVLHYSLL